MDLAPAWKDGDELMAQMRPLLEVLLAAPRVPRAQAVLPRAPGIYLFSDGVEYRYVGQTRNLRARLAQHASPSGTHYSATLAFLMAVQEAKEQGMGITGYTRAMLQGVREFAERFTRAKATVASWNVQVIEVPNPLVRTIFEVYVHATLKTDMNSFETH